MIKKMMNKMEKKMDILEINSGKHIRGNCRCDECWQGYPVKCTCGGLIHAEYLGQNGMSANNPMGVKCLCDKCGGKFLRAGNRYKGRSSGYRNRK